MEEEGTEDFGLPSASEPDPGRASAAAGNPIKTMASSDPSGFTERLACSTEVQGADLKTARLFPGTIEPRKGWGRCHDTDVGSSHHRG
jgi:hypothetical protein